MRFFIDAFVLCFCKFEQKELIVSYRITDSEEKEILQQEKTRLTQSIQLAEDRVSALSKAMEEAQVQKQKSQYIETDQIIHHHFSPCYPLSYVLDRHYRCHQVGGHRQS